MNVANILKPSLSRGEIQVIGATTFNEYRKYIEKDAALERRFQPVTVNEPSIEDTVEVLSGIKQYYEDYHKVKLPQAVVRAAAVLSERYITDRFLPDKAIDLIDEACANRALESPILTEYEKANGELLTCSKALEAAQQEVEKIDYEKIAKLKAQDIVLRERLKEMEPQVNAITVTEDDLAKVIELWTGIPVAKIRESDLKKVARLDEALKQRIIGQDEAVELVAAAIRRSRVQISARKRPASFIFVGPTGVGKTELVKVLSTELFDGVEPLIRLDMSEFMEKHSVSRIVGSPPGYVGYDEAGQLTEKVRRKPYSVVLFDEIEKAHPDVMNILLQILDEGKITDAHGRVVNFQNTVIVMTSNAGSQFKDTSLGFAKDQAAATADRARKALSEFLRPEFLARVDEVVVFRSLSREDYEKIAGLLLGELKAPHGGKGDRVGLPSRRPVLAGPTGLWQGERGQGLDPSDPQRSGGPDCPGAGGPARQPSCPAGAGLPGRPTGTGRSLILPALPHKGGGRFPPTKGEGVFPPQRGRAFSSFVGGGCFFSPFSLKNPTPFRGGKRCPSPLFCGILYL